MPTKIRTSRAADIVITAGMVVAITIGIVTGTATESANAAQPPPAPAKASAPQPNRTWKASQTITNRTGHTLELISWHGNTGTSAVQAPPARIPNGESAQATFRNDSYGRAPQTWVDYKVVDASGAQIGTVQAYENVDWLPFSWKATNSGSVGSGPFNVSWGNDGHSPHDGTGFNAWTTFTAKPSATTTATTAAVPVGNYRATTQRTGDTLKFTVGAPAADGTQAITHVVYFYAQVPGPMPLNDATLTDGHFVSIAPGPSTPFTIDATYNAATQAFHGTAGPKNSQLRRAFDATLLQPAGLR